VVAAKGITRYALGTYPIENFRFALPSPNEQASIAAFLDHESKKIDDLVADQEKLVVLLKEKRQGLISHIVTKGLDPKAPMRDSGVEWIGQVPKHWEIMPMRRAIDGIEQGWSAECENRSADDVEMAVVKLSAVKNGVFVPAENKVFHPSLEPEMRYEIKAGDFLLTRANTRDLVGECCIVGDEVRRGLMMPDLIYRIRFNSRVIPNYMLAWLRSVGGRYGISIDARGSSMTMAKIAQSHINCWPIPVPSPKEQMAIADAVDGFTTPINALIEQAEKASVLLKERRAALISAAVTGKIDVRSFVTPKKAVAA
jgi:type I restriction enzyme S subunit